MANATLRMTPNIGATERVITALVGAAGLAAARRQIGGRTPLVAASTALLVRAATGYCPVVARTRRHAGSDTRRWLGGQRGAHLLAMTTIDRPPDEVYAFWRDLNRLSTALPQAVNVSALDDRFSEWRLGDATQWTAEIIHDEPGRLIGWQTLPGADIVSAGSVKFTEAPGRRTYVQVRMQYSPPFGRVGAALAELFGRGAVQVVDESLAAAKRAIERAAPETLMNPIV